MAHIGNFGEVENPEKELTLRKANESAVPSAMDKQKLERPSENTEKCKLTKTDLSSADEGKEKLKSHHPDGQVLEKRQPENIETNLNNYFSDLKKRSDCPDTIKDRPFESKDLKKLSPEETSTKREEFDDKKSDLKKQWANEHGQPWPKYDSDVYSSNGKLIRKAGGDYDAHHIQPLGMDGKNEVSNITPLHASEHYDRQGVHAPDSPYSKLDKML